VRQLVRRTDHAIMLRELNQQPDGALQLREFEIANEDVRLVYRIIGAFDYREEGGAA
jgi:hypothetical protein